MKLIFTVLGVLAFLLAGQLLIINARARVAKSGLSDKVVSMMIFLRLPGLGAALVGIVEAAMGQIGWMILWLLVAAVCFGGAELVWRQQRTLASRGKG